MLQPIVASTRRRLEALIPRAAELEARAVDAAPVRDLEAALAEPGLQVIAEIKRRSPSAGPLATHLDPGAQAQRYADGGAAAISVLTEPEFFDGSLDDLAAVRSACDLPVLRKDFTLHPAQIWEARAAGADAVLLILAILDDAETAELLDTARTAGIAALVEAHNVAEVARVVTVGATIVGVNNRDLTTFDTDLATAESAASHLGTTRITVAESGVSTAAGAARMAAAGYDAILVGEAAVRAEDPSAFVRSLRTAGR